MKITTTGNKQYEMSENMIYIETCYGNSEDTRK